MSKRMIIEFMDADQTVGEYWGDRSEIIDGVVLSVWEQNAYGTIFGRQNFPLTSIKTYYWAKS